MTNNTFIVIDSFHDDAMKVRQSALAKQFEQPGNTGGFNGLRLRPAKTQARRWINKIQRLSHITAIYDPALQGHFKALTAEQQNSKKTFVHTDPCDWSAVVCLIPEGFPGGFTSFWRHRKFGLTGFHDRKAVDVACKRFKLNPTELVARCNDDSRRMDAWEEVDRINYRFNRLIMFRGRLFHLAGAGFGSKPKDSKLIQTFFFDERKGSEGLANH